MIESAGGIGHRRVVVQIDQLLCIGMAFNAVFSARTAGAGAIPGIHG